MKFDHNCSAHKMMAFLSAVLEQKRCIQPPPPSVDPWILRIKNIPYFFSLAVCASTLELLIDFFQGNIHSRNQLEKMYLTQWNKRFRKRLFMGHQMAKIFKNDSATALMWRLVQIFPFLVPIIIRNTHGKP